MTEDKRHQREMQATLKQIQEYHGDRKSGNKGRNNKVSNNKVPRWRLDISLGRLAIEGISVFLIGILVGLGLYVLYELITAPFAG